MKWNLNLKIFSPELSKRERRWLAEDVEHYILTHLFTYTIKTEVSVDKKEA